MNVNFINRATQSMNTPTMPPFPSRQDKAQDFLSNALPMALTTGLQAFQAPALGAAVGATAGGVAAGTAGLASPIAGGVMGALQLAMNWGKSTPAAGAASGLALGASIGTFIFPGIGTALGAGIGALAGGLIGCITSGKHKDQKVRDSVREGLIQMGVLNTDYQLQLANGSLYDMGKDGGARSELGGRRPFEVDFSNPLAQYAVGWMDPIIALLAPGNTKVRNDFAGYFANAALSNAKDLNDVRQNVNSFLARFGLTNESLVKGLSSLVQGGALDQTTAQAWVGGIQQRMNPKFQGDFKPTQEMAQKTQE